MRGIIPNALPNAARPTERTALGRVIGMAYRVGVVGMGRGLSLAHVFRVMPDCEVVACCDLDERHAVTCRDAYPGSEFYTDYARMLAAGLDIVAVATPIPKHAEHTIAALEAGCHVLQEVTLSNTIEGCRAIHDTVKKHPRQKFMIAENCCYWAYIIAWKRMWDEGLLGNFLYAEAEYVHNIRSLLRNADGTPTWRASRPPIIYCTHSLGPLLKVTGERCVSATCLSGGSKMDSDLGHLDFMVALFQTSSGGVLKVLRAEAFSREPAFHWYSLQGSRGCLETSKPPVSPMRTNAWFEDLPHLADMVSIPVRDTAVGLSGDAYAGGHGTIEYLMIQDFMKCIREDTPPPLDIYAALDMTLLGLCAYQSAMNGGAPVPIPDWRTA
jgi:predicted dehydrogenase